MHPQWCVHMADTQNKIDYKTGNRVPVSILSNIKLAIWMDSTFDLKIVESVKRSNILCLLLSDDVSVLDEYSRCYSPFLKVFYSNEWSLDKIIDHYGLNSTNVVVINNNSSTESAIGDVKLYVLTEKEISEIIDTIAVSKSKIGFEINTGFDYNKYLELISKGEKKEIIDYLEGKMNDPEACVLLVRFLMSQNNKDDELDAYKICTNPKQSTIPEVKCLLADIYYRGLCVDRSLNMSISILQGADLSKVPSYYEVLLDRLIERDERFDSNLAIELCKKGQHYNNNLAYRLAIMYRNGILVTKNIDKAIENCFTALKFNIGKSKNLAIDLLLERKANGDIERAFEMCKSFAKEGDPWAQLRLARMYRHGLGTKTDIEKSYKLLVDAYVSGVKDAKYELISLIVTNDKELEKMSDTIDLTNDADYRYQKARELSKDPSNLDEAISLLKGAPEKNKSEAINLLIDLLLKRGSDEDLKEAFDLCESNIDNLWTRGRLSRLYRDGIFVQQDLDKAIDLMSEPAHNGINWARNEYADMLMLRGGNSDYKEAFSVCLQGAFDEDVWSQIKLSRMYYQGKGTKKDVQNALVLMRTAAKKGNNTAVRELKQITDEIKAAQTDD